MGQLSQRGRDSHTGFLFGTREVLNGCKEKGASRKCLWGWISKLKRMSDYAIVVKKYL